MVEQAHIISDSEKLRLRHALSVAFSTPLVADVEGFTWEAVFHYVKGLRLPDPISEGRSKLLFDAVSGDGLGWSLKTLLWNQLTVGASFEFVIQRADTFKKADSLGYPKGLSRESDPQSLGNALIRHWNAKLEADATAQEVKVPRLAVLLKNRARERFVYVELDYPPFDETQFVWRWSRDDGFGLQGSREGRVRLKWYYGQKQLFQVYEIPQQVFSFEIQRKPRVLKEFMDSFGEEGP